LLASRAPRARIGLLAGLVAAVAALILALPVAAGSWSSYYGPADYYAPGRIELSGLNESIGYNLVTFPGNGLDYMQLTLCDQSYQCYPYTFSQNSFSDSRTISYGRAKCNAWQYNSYSLYVNYCYANNWP
jgi:hypothetical protein